MDGANRSPARARQNNRFAPANKGGIGREALLVCRKTDRTRRHWAARNQVKPWPTTTGSAARGLKDVAVSVARVETNMVQPKAGLPNSIESAGRAGQVKTPLMRDFSFFART
jgi:hypothetical protein